jgi:hypothetical protein
MRTGYFYALVFALLTSVLETRNTETCRIRNDRRRPVQGSGTLTLLTSQTRIATTSWQRQQHKRLQSSRALQLAVGRCMG